MEIEKLYSRFLECNGVTTDSRRCPQGSMFFALKGGNFNGNAFAAKALESGCRYAVIDEAEYTSVGDERYLLVSDCLQALQQLARHHRRTLATPVIGITGTNGKTTTKELIAAVLTTKYNLLYTQGNLNNQIGVPLTLLSLRSEHELAVVEMGASHPGDIEELVNLAEPDYGLITNVGKAHLEGFGSLEGVIRTKGELFDYLRRAGKQTVFLHADNPYLQNIARGLQQVTYGSGEALYVSGRCTSCSPFLHFAWHGNGEIGEREVKTQLIGEYNLPNALAAVTVGRYFDVSADEICRALGAYVPQNNRSQLKCTADNTLIIDAYNANPTSMMASIENFHRMQAEGKMLILGDMRELGKESAEEHQKIADYLRQCGFDDVMLVGECFAKAIHSYPCYSDATALAEELKRHKPTGRTILIKGSNGIRLSSIVDYL